jgi:type IV secretory pathway VirB10-like protein
MVQPKESGMQEESRAELKPANAKTKTKTKAEKTATERGRDELAEAEEAMLAEMAKPPDQPGQATSKKGFADQLQEK